MSDRPLSKQTVTCNCSDIPPTMPTYRTTHLVTCPVWVVENVANVIGEVKEPVTLQTSKEQAPPDVEYALTLMGCWGRTEGPSGPGGACRLAERTIQYLRSENERLQGMIETREEALRALTGDSPTVETTKQPDPYVTALAEAGIRAERDRRIIDRHVRWREQALGFLRQVVDGRGSEDEWPALAEFIEQSESRVSGASAVETSACQGCRVLDGLVIELCDLIGAEHIPDRIYRRVESRPRPPDSAQETTINATGFCNTVQDGRPTSAPYVMSASEAASFDKARARSPRRVDQPEKVSEPRCPGCGGEHVGTDCKAEKANAEV